MNAAPEAGKALLAAIDAAASDRHELVALLRLHRAPGMHLAVCRRLQPLDIADSVPQLIQAMLQDTAASLPVYSLLVHKARTSLSFQTRLFLALRSVLGKADEGKASCCYFLCCDLFNIARRWQNRNLATLALNRRAASSSKRRKESASADANIGGPHPPREAPPGDRGGNTGPCKKHLFPRKKRLLSRTFSVIPPKTKMPSFRGLILSFARTVSCLVDSSLFRSLDLVSRVFGPKKNFKNLSTNRQTSTLFKRNIVYYDALVGISNRLRKQPVGLRQRTLEAELAYLNLTMPGTVVNPFDPSTAIACVTVEECTTLDSAENVPYLVVAEVVDRRTPLGRPQSSRTYKAGILQSHLRAVNEISDVGDINGIRENILEALELVLFEKGEDEDHRSARGGADAGEMVILNYRDVDAGGKAAAREKTPSPLINSSKVSWDSVRDRIRLSSPFSKCPAWSLLSFIVKSGSVMKQEYLAYQILSQMKEIFLLENTRCFLRTYKIYLISETAGLIETVNDARSIHKIRSGSQTLLEYFQASFKDQGAACHNFLRSLAGYSLASFLLQIKDRHNGNILIDPFGHIVHVDFGFIFGAHPGFYCVENAPFKFSAEYLGLVDLADFRSLFLAGFRALRTHHCRITRLVAGMEGSGFCPIGTAAALCARLNLDAGDREVEEYCTTLIDRSINNMRTTVYDRFQYFSNGYY